MNTPKFVPVKHSIQKGLEKLQKWYMALIGQISISFVLVGTYSGVHGLYLLPFKASSIALEPSVKLEYVKQKWDKPKVSPHLRKQYVAFWMANFEILTSNLKFNTCYVPPTPLSPQPGSTAGIRKLWRPWQDQIDLITPNLVDTTWYIYI